MFRFIGALFAIGSFFLMAAGIGFLWLNSAINAPLPLSQAEAVNVHIDAGSSLGGIAAKLEKEKVINNALVFKMAAVLMDSEKKLQAGEYQIKPGMSIADIVVHMREGRTTHYKVTVPEGLTVQQILELVKKEDRLTGDIELAPQEGSLLPNTYHFVLESPRSDVIQQMQEAMSNLKAELWEKRAADLPFDTWDEAIILASIVEKETSIIGEMPRIAGVFVNRLNRGMKLQSDPTVIYALTEGYGHMRGKRLYRKYLKIDSPYNTYMNTGLPVGPIANPGRHAIAAVLHPEKHDYLYFVADGTGGHVFAKSYAEHRKNVAEWREFRRKNK